jgi:cytochrome c biogenesis protein CcmG/thiol:disulfide interchange protein DsbE
METNATTATQGRGVGNRSVWWIVGGCLVLAALFFCCVCSGLAAFLAVRSGQPQAFRPPAPVLPVERPQPPAVAITPAPRREPAAPGAALAPGSPVGQAAPDFTLRDLAGREWHLNEVQGHPVVINFWATWCPPCREEMPALEDAWLRYHDQGLIILAVNLDEPEDRVASFARQFNLTLPLLVGARGDSLGQAYRVRYLPTSYFLDKDGVIQAYVVGGMTQRDIEGNLDKVGITR